MDTPEQLSEGIESWNTAMLLYNSALKEVGTKLEILNDEFQQCLTQLHEQSYHCIVEYLRLPEKNMSL